MVAAIWERMERVNKWAFSSVVNIIQSRKPTHYESYFYPVSHSATYFMTYHTVLKNSSDYIEALKEGRKVASNISNMTTSLIPGLGKDFDVFTYR